MDRIVFDQIVSRYFEWLLKEHCKTVQNSSLTRYLYKRAILFAYADYYINHLGYNMEQAFGMLLMEKDEREEYLRIH